MGYLYQSYKIQATSYHIWIYCKYYFQEKWEERCWRCQQCVSHLVMGYLYLFKVLFNRGCAIWDGKPWSQPAIYLFPVTPLSRSTYRPLAAKGSHVLLTLVSDRTLNPYSTGIDISRQNLTSVDVRFWRLKSIPVCRRQILTTKVDPRSVKFENICNCRIIKTKSLLSMVYTTIISALTLPLPISHSCENYLPLPIFHCMHGWKSPTRMVSGIDGMLSCILICAICVCACYNLYGAQWLYQRSSLKKEVGFWG